MSRPVLYWRDGTLTSAGGTVIEQNVTLDEAGALYMDETITVTLQRLKPCPMCRGFLNACTCPWYCHVHRAT